MIVSALYGTPFLRKYPDFIRVVTTLSEPPRPPPPAKNPPTTGADRSQLATEPPCQSPPGVRGAPKAIVRVCVPASLSILSVWSSVQLIRTRVGRRINAATP